MRTRRAPRTGSGRGSRRRLAWLVGVAALAVLASACSRETDARDELEAAIAATRAVPYRFVYTEERPGRTIEVQGLVEDDFRYKARLLQGGVHVLDEVVNDDAIAVRFAAPEAVDAFLDPTQVGVADVSTAIEGVTVLDALRARRWVLDVAGAPDPADPARVGADLGADPVFDALGTLGYVERAMREAAEVVRWSPDSLNPAYRRSEDPFPRPADGSGVIRYDLRRPPLPRIGVQTGSSSQEVPENRHFRKMAIYVRDGVVIRVEERIEVTGRFAEDFIDYNVRFLRELGATEDQIARFRESFRGLDEAARSRALLEGLNQGLAFAGVDPVDIRSMTLTLFDHGDPTISAELPTEIIEGGLAVLINRGVKEPVAEDGSTAATAA